MCDESKKNSSSRKYFSLMKKIGVRIWFEHGTNVWVMMTFKELLKTYYT
jgi:hypothetical protein